MADRFDAVLIGAGVNTLACALHLAAKGWRVGVFEQAATPGGAVKTGEYTLPGFRHDWAAMNLSLFAGSPFFRTYGPELTQHGLRLVVVGETFASVFPDRRWLGVSTVPADTEARIAGFDPQDAESWLQTLADFQADAPHLFRLLGSPMKMRALASFMFGLLRAKGVKGSLDIGRLLLSSPRSWLTGRFRSPQVQAAFAAWGMHLDFAPDIAGGAIFPYLEMSTNQLFGMTLGRGGAETVIQALVAAITARGGMVECNAPVARIMQTGGRATGIELADGRQIGATKAVIAGVAPGALVRLTGGMAPAFDKAMADFVHAPGTMMIHLAMDSLPDWAAGAALQSYAYVHLAPTMDQMARTYQQAQAGMLPDEPVIVVGQPTAHDTSRAPRGKHVLWVQVRMAPAVIRGDAAGQIAATDWAEAAEPFAERALDILEKYAPGTRAKILARRIVSPLDLEAENPNLVGGDQICGSHHLSQNFLFRPARGHADGSTSLKNLHLTGAAVWPGAGTGAGPGYLLARKLSGK